MVANNLAEPLTSHVGSAPESRIANDRGLSPRLLANGTHVVVLSEYQSDLESSVSTGYIGFGMTLVIVMVIVALALLYLAVVAEERHMQEAVKVRKR
jgi:hypothetical protein